MELTGVRVVGIIALVPVVRRQGSVICPGQRGCVPVQVRTIEFQQSFARVPLEGARQQSVLLREPQLAQQAAAQVGGDEQTLNLSRPRPTSQAEGGVVDPEGHRGPGGSGGRSGRRRPSGSNETGELRLTRRGERGARIDVTV